MPKINQEIKDIIIGDNTISNQLLENIEDLFTAINNQNKVYFI